MSDQAVRKEGGCLCGGVRYVVHGPLRPITTCHCTMCRRQTGLYYAATECRRDDLELVTDETLSWYASSSFARRGFCGRCGSALFWQLQGADYISILAGSLDGETGLSIDRQIFTNYKGDFYDLIEGVPVFGESD